MEMKAIEDMLARAIFVSEARGLADDISA